MSVMRDQRTEFIAFLEALSAFDYLPMVAYDAADLENECQRALGPATVGDAGKQGVIAIFNTVVAPRDGRDDGSRVFRFLHQVAVLENPTINRFTGAGSSGTQIDFEEWIERIVTNSVQVFKPTNAASYFTLEPEGIELVSAQFADDKEIPGKQATFSCLGTLDAPALTACATPTITADEETGALTLACTTPGAALFYTTDGKRPSPQNGTLYTAPFIPAAGLTVKVRAWQWGYLPSEIATHLAS